MSTIIPGSSESDCGVAAVDEQVATGHEGRGIAREVDGGARDLLGQTEATEQVLRAHHLASLVHVRRGGGLLAGGRAVGQDVEPPEPLEGGGEGGTPARAVRDVEMQRQCLRAALLDLGGGGLGPRLLDVGARDTGAGRRERERGRAPDSVRRTDDDGGFLLERERRVDHRDLLSPAPRAGATVYASRADGTIAVPGS